MFFFSPFGSFFLHEISSKQNHSHPFMHNVTPKPMASFVEVSKLLDFEFSKQVQILWAVK
jgi:hypothetical protein